jgi:hypothetical protein
MEQWWLSEIPELLEQGDVVTDIAFGFQMDPPHALVSASMKGGVRGWTQSEPPRLDGQGQTHFLHKGPYRSALLLNHGCDIDKQHTKRLIVVPIFALGEVPERQRQDIANQGVIANVFLPDVPKLGDCFADLRIMQSIPKSNVERAERVAAMTPEARQLLGVRLIAFFMRVDLSIERGS